MLRSHIVTGNLDLAPYLPVGVIGHADAARFCNPFKIADATLEQPHNVYTKALDEGAILRVVAQPTMKDGRLHRLFITDAKLAPRRRVKA